MQLLTLASTIQDFARTAELQRQESIQGSQKVQVKQLVQLLQVSALDVTSQAGTQGWALEMFCDKDCHLRCVGQKGKTEQGI